MEDEAEEQVEVEAPAEVADAPDTPTFLEQSLAYAGRIAEDFPTMEPGEQLGVIAAVIAIVTAILSFCGAVWWVVRIPARRAKRRQIERKALEEREKELARQKALQDNQKTLQAQLDAAEAREQKTQAMIEQLMAMQSAQAGTDADPEALTRARDAAEELAEQGGEKEAALARIAEGDEAGFDQLAALAQAETSAAKQAEAEADDKARAAARVWTDIGDLAYLNHTHRAVDAYEQARALTPGDANIVNRLGALYLRLGDLADAEAAFRAVLDSANGDKDWEATALGNLGLIARTRGDLDAAEDFHTRSLAIEEALGRKEGMAADLGNLGLIARRRGDLDAAEDFHTRSLAIEEALGRKEGIAAELGNLGAVAQTRGDVAEACRLWSEALALYRQIGARPEIELVSGWLREHGRPDAPPEDAA